MSAIQKYKILILRIDGKNIGVPLVSRALATLEDVDELEQTLRLEFEVVKAHSVAITTDYVPSQAAGTSISVTTANIPFISSTENIGRMVIFGSTGTKIGIVTGVSQYYTTVMLLK